eukprot:CAMPEP_0194272614 /NCGR_PEP_ID=MMETSP0169-20130528/6134_1 /TAXON_ID=218684 /ORGANISM="Corethron pennatum, Strain L29A3" /LENGTH=506 /DNA_ID=CAMNT_0039015319 /DNA_START=55 /DNA_END=1575 /DNA_ORIENTATION=+
MTTNTPVEPKALFDLIESENWAEASDLLKSVQSGNVTVKLEEREPPLSADQWNISSENIKALMASSCQDNGNIMASSFQDHNFITGPLSGPTADPSSISSGLSHLGGEEKTDTIRDQIHRLVHYTDEIDRTTLHLVCGKQGPVELISQLTSLSDKLVRARGNQHCLPIHHACYYYKTRLDVIMKLLSIYPEAASELTMYDWSPLHCACFSGVPLPGVLSLLEINAAMVNVRNNENDYPLLFVWEKLARCLRSSKVREPPFQGEIHAHWELLCYLIRVTHYGVPPSKLPHTVSDDGLLFATLTIDCPPSLLKFIVNSFANQALIPLNGSDGMKDFPLHKILGMSNVPSCYGRRDIQAEDVVLKNKYGFVDITSKLDKNEALKRRSFGSTIDILLSVCPKSAFRLSCVNDQTPLATAIIDGRKTFDTGLRTLTEVAPLSLQTRDITTHMYPFMLAACYLHDNDLLANDLSAQNSSKKVQCPPSHNLNISYQLLRACPNVLQSFLNIDT